MSNHNHNDSLGILGDVLLRQFYGQQPEEVPTALNDRCLQSICLSQRSRVNMLRYALRAAVVVLAIMGTFSLVILSSGSLRQRAGEYLLQTATETTTEEQTVPFVLISSAYLDSTQINVYTDGADNYRIMWLDESGRRFYHFHAADLDSSIIMQFSEKISGLNRE